MAGDAGGLRAGLRRWWSAPAPLEVLTGEADYVRAAVVSLTRFSALGALVSVPAVVLTQPGGERLNLLIGVGVLLPAIVLMLWLSTLRGIGRPLLIAAVCTAAAFVGWWLGVSVEQYPAMILTVTICVATVTVWLPRRWAIGASVLGLAVYLVTGEVRDIPHLYVLWVPAAAFSLQTVVDLSLMLDRVHGLSEAERAAQAEVLRLAAAEREAREELASANEQLALRVEEQGDRIAGLGRLRQFLSPQVADAIEADALVPHRGQIAVVFCDLRGFTRFSNSSEPEELLDVLEAYYAVVGAKLREYDATVGSFQGDGILAYFNDPVPCEDPAGRAVRMALDLRAPLDALCDRWARRGYDLGYGMGIAYGYATLGTIGFEGRLDYTPLGSVVNMASRLGDEAGWGEILIDGRALHAVDDRVEVEGRNLELKGFPSEVPAYTVLAAPGL